MTEPPMDAERWRRVNELFHAALERDEQAREAFLQEACGDDAELRQEVGSLLASHAQDDDFITRPAFVAGADLLRPPSGEEVAARADALVGKMLGPYRIKSGLGYGGMGVVWLAEDTRLDRAVALKALADHLTRDQRSRARLRREAKAAAALSHPGVATVYALEELEDHLYIAYEYVEGPTLREELQEGAADRETLLRTSVAIAGALQAAHELGIVHRDLKPENIVRTRDGGIKILDFGLASYRPGPVQADSGGDQARLTLPGMLVGTPSYMSPEQLRGRDVDPRSDLFSLGVILYELAGGNHPFEGDDPASTIARILEVEPRELPEELAGELAEIEPVLRRLLAKDPEDRYADAAALVTDLQVLVSGELPQLPPAQGERPHHDAFWWWRFHQFALTTVYGLAGVGAWLAREWSSDATLSPIAAVLFYTAVALGTAAGSMRLHLAFAARYYPAELPDQLRRAQSRILMAEFFFAGTLVGLASLVDREGGRGTFLLSTLLFATAGGILVFAKVIEPATTRAAFRGRPE